MKCQGSDLPFKDITVQYVKYRISIQLWFVNSKDNLNTGGRIMFKRIVLTCGMSMRTEFNLLKRGFIGLFL